MANKATDFNDIKNLREWLDKRFEEGKFLYRISSAYPDGQKCEDVDLIWDGTNYHISYTSNADGKIYVQPFTYTDEIVWYIK